MTKDELEYTIPLSGIRKDISPSKIFAELRRISPSTCCDLPKPHRG